MDLVVLIVIWVKLFFHRSLFLPLLDHLLSQNLLGVFTLKQMDFEAFLRHFFFDCVHVFL